LDINSKNLTKMKKNLLFVLSVITFSILFLSCSDDDKEDNDTSQSFTINNKKQEVLNSFFETSGSTQYCLGALFGDDMLSPSQFEIYYNKTDINLNDLKAGDELPTPQKIAYWVKFTTGTSQTGSSEFESGTATITSIDVANKKIKVRFNNFKIKHNYENTTFTLNGELDINPAKW